MCEAPNNTMKEYFHNANIYRTLCIEHPFPHSPWRKQSPTQNSNRKSSSPIFPYS